MNEMNIHTISDLQSYVWSFGFPGLLIRGFGQIYEHGLGALPSKPTPSIKYHRKAKNQYLSRYGERWAENLKSSSAKSEFYCITDLIQFLIKEEDKLMKGYVYEYNFFIVHGALVLMKEK